MGEERTVSAINQPPSLIADTVRSYKAFMQLLLVHPVIVLPVSTAPE